MCYALSQSYPTFGYREITSRFYPHEGRKTKTKAHVCASTRELSLCFSGITS